MCGIAGAWQAGVGREAWEALLDSMGSALRHRGPDDAGTWCDPDAGIGVVSRRLAIIDVSPLGHQPMTSASERFVVAYNGELYNFQDLRQELERLGHRFRGHSDTEVLLAAVDQWGIREAIPRFNGMFAFALWDREHRRLHLVRDRVGEKPLYYGWAGGAFVFGSELKALRVHPAVTADVDRDALALFLRHGYVPAPYSIYRGIAKLVPGSILTIDQRTTRAGQTPVPERYWSAKEAAEQGARDPFTGNEADAADRLDHLLR